MELYGESYWIFIYVQTCDKVPSFWAILDEIEKLNSNNINVSGYESNTSKRLY